MPWSVHIYANSSNIIDVDMSHLLSSISDNFGNNYVVTKILSYNSIFNIFLILLHINNFQVESNVPVNVYYSNQNIDQVALKFLIE